MISPDALNCELAGRPCFVYDYWFLAFVRQTDETHGQRERESERERARERDKARDKRFIPGSGRQMKVASCPVLTSGPI